jgi:hypothetical protein
MIKTHVSSALFGFQTRMQSLCTTTVFYDNNVAVPTSFVTLHCPSGRGLCKYLHSQMLIYNLGYK